MFDNNRPDAIDIVRRGRRTHQLGSSQLQTYAHRDNGGWYMVTQDWCAANVLILLPRSPVIGNRANCHSCGLVHLPTSCCCCCIYLHELTNKMCHAFGWSFAVTGVRAVRLSANMQMSMTKRTQSNITGLPDAYYTAACRLLFATAAAAVARIDTATPPKSENRDCTTFATKHTTYEIMYPNAFVMDTKQQIHT